MCDMTSCCRTCCVWHDLFKGHIHMSDMTCSNDTFTCVWHDSSTCVWHDSFKRHVHMCDMTCSNNTYILVCSWKIEVWTGTGLFWGLQAKGISTDKFWENRIYMNTLCTLVRDFQVKALHVESYPRDSKRVFGEQGVTKDVFWELWATKWVKRRLLII